jgi:peptide-methionine (R)-S-oxide reductase
LGNNGGRGAGGVPRTPRDGTEAPKSGGFFDTKTTGVYRFRASDAELFRGNGRFDARCGWPSSFISPVAGEAIVERSDVAWGVECARC